MICRYFNDIISYIGHHDSSPNTDSHSYMPYWKPTSSPPASSDISRCRTRRPPVTFLDGWLIRHREQDTHIERHYKQLPVLFPTRCFTIQVVVYVITWAKIQYIPRNMHTVFALLCFVVVIHWLIFPYPSGLLHWHCCNLTIAPVPAKQPWWIWINTSCEFIMNDCITTTKQSTTKPCAYFLGYTVAC